MSALVGQRLGQYEIVEPIGRGGMATVYRARQASIRRDVAIKVIKPDLPEIGDFVQRFEREAQTVATLSHPYILKVFDYGQHGDTVYLVMELLTGGSLAQLIRGGSLSLERASQVLDQLASALDYAHGLGIIHRDLKPQNVLLDAQGNAILTDFGIAKLLTDNAALTQSGIAMGTPAYMAPEQWRGEPADARSDVYAVGVILYEMLAGRIPFVGDTPYSLMHSHIYDAPPPIEGLRADLAANVDHIINRTLAKDREDRYGSASALALAFRSALRGAFIGQDAPNYTTEAQEPYPAALPTIGISASQALAQERRAIERLEHENFNRTVVLHTRFINPLPQDVSARYVGRAKEQSDIANLLMEKTRLVSVYGRGGVGKTALVSKVLGDLQNETLINGMVYLSAVSTGISLDRIIADFAKLLGGESQEQLDAALSNSQLQPAQKIATLLEKLAVGHYILLLDNMETLQDPATGALTDANMQTFFETALAQGSGLRTLITSREPLVLPRPLKTWERLIPLEEGLLVDDAISLLRNFDPDGAAGLRDAPAEQLQVVAERTGGFPRAMEALAGLLLEDPLLSLDDLVRDMPLLSGEITPIIVQEAITRLSPDAIQVMEALAVFERPATQVALEFLLAPYMDTSGLRALLARLVRGYFANFNKATQQFAMHPIDRAYCYSLIPEGTPQDYTLTPPPYTRSALHFRAAEFYRRQRRPESEWKTLEALSPQFSEFDHRVAAGDYETALNLVLSFDENYLTPWGQLVRLAALYERLDGHITDPQLERARRSRLGWAYREDFSLWKKAIPYFEERIVEARRDGDKQTEADCNDALGHMFQFMDVKRGIEYRQRALAIYRETGNRRGEGDSLGGLGWLHWELGQFETALTYLQQAAVIHREIENFGSMGWTINILGISYLRIGKFSEAIAYSQQSLAMAAQGNHLLGQGTSHMTLGTAYGWLGQIDLAIDHMEQALALFQQMNNHPLGGVVRYNQAIIHLISGDDVRALQTNQAALENAAKLREMGTGFGGRSASAYVLCNALMAELWLFIGDLDEAHQAIVTARSVEVRENNYVPAMLHGIIAARMSQIDEARPAFEESVGMADEALGNSPGNFEAAYARALSVAGLALLGAGDVQTATDSVIAARAVCSAAGVVTVNLRLLDALMACTGGEMLALVRAALVGNNDQ